MTAVQRITIEGKGYVLLPEDDYQDLVDASEASAIKARIDAGEETWPSEVVNAIIDGENAIRVFRKYRGLTIEELAAKAGLSQPFVSQIETGKKEGSIAALKAIARVLGVDLDDIA
ncbi:helix-turn-helix domain-containing protein [Rhizobium sp. Nf11,1]|uniref:helix-turn-helix domain-containing protein n=1 Tax=Rhizobium sp. Nf11,1 TaxID=3404923 RepID=UPI003D334748